MQATAELDAATAMIEQLKAAKGALLEEGGNEVETLRTRLQCTETELASAHKMIEMVQKARDLCAEEVSVTKGQAEKIN